MVPDDPLIGRQLANYRLERLVGCGGMAAVYYGWDVQLQRPVAVKVIDARYRSNRAYAERFVREARAVATWRHEHIVQVYYAGEEDGLYYFAMEYIDGLDLDTLLSEYVVAGELMPPADVLRVGQAVASALDYAHARGVVHRDIKPGNVLVANDGRVVLTDFGLAMDVEQGSVGEVFGSANYISPEQARHSADAVAQSDQYSLGVMLFELLTGRVPFTDASPTSVALQHIMNPPPDPREANPVLSEETAAVLLRALSKTPQERYGTCAELVEALATSLQPSAAAASFAAGRERKEAPPAPSISNVSVAERVALYRQAVASAAKAAGEGAAGPAEEPVEEPAVEPAVAPADSLIGTQLDEYRLETLLGQGGMARIYRGLDVRLKRFAAIKVIDAPRRSDPDYVRRFEREAQAIAQLEHPHIVRLYRYGQTHGVLYMAMQYVEGQDLHSLLSSYREREKLVPTSKAIQIIREVCQALDYAHGKGVIHRDVKPSNIMLDRDGHAVLTDFGLALLTESGTHGEAFGSPRYIAPEQAISSARVVPQSDLYAIGVIVYEMFTGVLPFDAPDALSMVMKHMTEPPRPPREVRPALSPAVEAVMLKALAKEPAERYPTGAAFVASLDRALAAGPARAAVTLPASLAADAAPTPTQAPGGLTTRPLPPAAAAGAPPAAGEPSTLTAPPRPAWAPWRRRPWLVPLVAGVLLLAALAAVGLLLGPRLFARGPNSTPAASATYGMPVVVKPGRSPSATPTSPAPSTWTPTATSSPTPTSTPTATVPPTTVPPTTAPPTSFPVPVPPSPTPSATPLGYDLLLARRADESLFVVNRGTLDLPLAGLRLGLGDGRVDGDEWGIDVLKSGHCVAVWNGKGHPRAPQGLDCTPDVESKHLTREGKGVFWRAVFPVYYEGAQVSSCFSGDEDTCRVYIPLPH